MRIKDRIGVFRDYINFHLSEAASLEGAEKNIFILIEFYARNGLDLTGIPAEKLSAFQSELTTCIIHLERLGWKTDSLAELKEQLGQLMLILKGRDEVVLLLNPADRVENIVNTVLPHLEELENDGKTLDDSESIRDAIDMYLGADLPIESLNARQIDSLLYALPKISAKIQCMDPDLAQIIVFRIDDWMGRIERVLSGDSPDLHSDNSVDKTL
ncbi:hypothetical protein JW752_04555 [Candidatus Peregrinibacteria bacterium]|nr:hypothetical protein [Candidatus Peregrinibacteria bacterium]